MFLHSSFISPDHRINIEEYNALRAGHPNDNKRRGDFMYFKEHLPISRCDDLCNLPECLVTEIRIKKKKKCFFTSLYRFSSQSLTSLIHSVLIPIFLFLSNINDLNPASLLVIGDLNARISSIIWSYLAHFPAQAPKKKKIYPEKIPYISGNGTF